VLLSKTGILTYWKKRDPSPFKLREQRGECEKHSALSNDHFPARFGVSIIRDAG
jgi:hypothetical protein